MFTGKHSYIDYTSTNKDTKYENTGSEHIEVIEIIKLWIKNNTYIYAALLQKFSPSSCLENASGFSRGSNSLNN